MNLRTDVWSKILSSQTIQSKDLKSFFPANKTHHASVMLVRLANKGLLRRIRHGLYEVNKDQIEKNFILNNNEKALYLVQFDDGRYKIGSSKDPNKRLGNLCRTMGRNMKSFKIWEGKGGTESLVHAKLSKWHLTNEFYQFKSSKEAITNIEKVLTSFQLNG